MPSPWSCSRHYIDSSACAMPMTHPVTQFTREVNPSVHCLNTTHNYAMRAGRSRARARPGQFSAQRAPPLLHLSKYQYHQKTTSAPIFFLIKSSYISNCVKRKSANIGAIFAE